MRPIHTLTMIVLGWLHSEEESRGGIEAFTYAPTYMLVCTMLIFIMLGLLSVLEFALTK